MLDGIQGERAPDDESHEIGPSSNELGPDALASLEWDLTRSTGTQAADAAARIEADRRIVEILRRDDFSGPRYDKVAARWWNYGWRIIIKWSRTGEIFARARAAGRPVKPRMITSTWTQDDRVEVATDAMISGMELFRDRGLRQGGWNPEGGASLTTFVVGAAVRSYRPAYETWFIGKSRLAELDIQPQPYDEEEPRDIPDQRAVDPYYVAATADDLARVLPHIPDTQLRKGLGLRALGYTQAEAAFQVGLTEKALERRLSRTRTRVLNAYQQEPELGEGGAR
ncbi:hypothetical protein OG571_46855 (plasmid) [Streptomyces sp. NBC_01369]|uniref:hypothetical protein n=1 Tax=unclassified Streptomyces TaxID=2593676 RepID=UPI00225BE556|nr:hypothetical protein [Streptomyces sp. NBC_00892]MCX4902460.1 hypothetical protein [Streptomyces sp. NBC_00892]